MLEKPTVRHQDLLMWQQFLLGTLIDSRLGYHTVMQRVQSQAVREFCLSKSYERADMAQALAAQISWSGAQPRRRGSPLGQLHRLWLRQLAFRPSEQQAIRECLRAEAVARDNYIDVVGIVGLPEELVDLLKRQLNHIESSILELQLLP